MTHCRILILMLIAAAVCLMSVGAGAAAVITVDDSGSAMYTEIQAAINAASPGDEIHVNSGTYYEHVNVNKQLILQGVNTGDGMPIVDARKTKTVIIINADGVTLDGFTVTNASVFPYAGIEVLSNNNTLNGNTISNNSGYGIHLMSSNDNMILGNNASNNGHSGIYLKSSINNTVIGNTASNNYRNGIWLYNSSNNTVNGNTVISNTQSVNGAYGIAMQFSSNNNTVTRNTVSMISSGSFGIQVYSSSNNTVNDNTVSNNMIGIHMQYPGNNTVSNNIALNNNWGIYLVHTSNNMVIENTASNNGYGIWLSSSSNNTVNGNTASNNRNNGILLLASASNNTISNNYFNNYNNFGFRDTIYFNQWNIVKIPSTNIVGGSYLGGNFWAKPDGTGFSQTCTDADLDGICDLSYTLASDNVDNLPLATFDTTSPTLIITLPTDGAIFSIPTITVSGTAADDTGVANLTVNDNSVTLETNGSFTTTVSLTSGMNNITVVATDLAGNKKTEIITVYFAGNGTEILANSVYTSMQPIIDGLLSLNEWGEPAIIETLSYTNDSVNYETHDMFVYFMNDNNYLYIAVKITNDDYESNLSEDWDKLEIWFDGDNNEIIESGEDIKEFTNLVYGDWFYEGNNTWSSDATLDGEGEASHSNQAIGDYTYEFKVPLNSGDTHDLSVTSDSTIGVLIRYLEFYYIPDNDSWLCNGTFDAWPNNGSKIDGSNYGKLKLSSSATSVDTEKPNITFSTPTDGTTVTTPTIIVSGTATDDTSVASVTVNDIPAIGTTNWSANVTLTEGTNTITVIATDTSGNTASETIIITYTPISGDFSGDSTTDAWDITYLARSIIGILGYEILSSGDVSGDGVVDAWDCTYLARAIAVVPGYNL